MFLKSLTLKGFKSFADRAHMTFEPGLTVIVGPNGSGKSNVSDAILWVLGEQSAKQLRGQAMEDVIFSGSSARQPVGVAEVTLVLDNSDHTLPVDFSEVAVTRRMYRSGESEYLINSSPCRLMDIQDILHDSGLGKDTHSIISQGKLDAILQSRPEERRSLIEEAAGISKHKRRKERALRKIASMDEHLVRARDINREITRQLRPLERQVDRARKHRELSERAHELTQILAVDELRRLQASWSDIESAGKEAAASLELAQYRVGEKERELEKLQVMLEEKGLFVGDLGERRRHIQDVVGRIGSDMRLLEEKGRNMVARLSEMRSTVSSSEHQRRRVSSELEDVLRQLDEQRGAAHAAQQECERLAPAAEALRSRRTELTERISALTRSQREHQREADAAALDYVNVKEAVAGAEREDAMYASRLEQMETEAQDLRDSLESRQIRAEDLEEELSAVRDRREEARVAIADAMATVDKTRDLEAAARAQLTEANSELSSLLKLDERLQDISPLASEVGQACAESVRAHLGDVLEAPRELEGVVERLLGADLDALIVDDDALEMVGRKAEAATGAGQALVLAASAPSAAQEHPPCGWRLLDKLSIQPGYEGAAEVLLGQVWVVASLKEALSAPTLPGVVYLTEQGALVCGGSVRVGSAGDAATGILERKRRIRELQALQPELSAAADEAAEEANRATQDLSTARAADGELAGEIARLEGERRSLLAEIGRMEQSLSSGASELARVRRRREEAARNVEDARPQLEELARVRDEARKAAEELTEQVELANEELERIRIEDSDAAGELADAKVRLAQATERLRSLEAREPELARRLEGVDRKIRATTQAAQSLDVLRLRVDPLHDRYQALLERAMDWAARLRDQASIEEADSASLKKTIETARADVEQARADLAQAQEDNAAVQVARGKLEVQVESAIAAITADGTTVLEDALTLPAPTDRAACERELNELVAKINGLGPVNQVAFEEYERLSERAEYIATQLADLETARAALTKITAAIDRKMRSAFLTTFEKVDANFREVFEMLFPGGSAHLEMTDPDHPAQTGIEVVAQPRGKRIAKMMLMSGGEKSLTALALLFAVYRTRTVPFYVLDEVEAALDDSNLSKLIGALDVLRQNTQLLVISHQRRTMEDADVLYGVSMQADGVSRVVSQKLDRETGKVVNA